MEIAASLALVQCNRTCRIVDTSGTVANSCELVPQDVPEPGQDDDRWFEQHWTVGYWRDQTYRPKEDMSDLRGLASAAAESARQANVLQDTTSAAYWAYHSARWFFFFTQAAASVFLTSARTGDLAKGKVTYIFDDPLDRNSATQITWVRIGCRLSGQQIPLP